MAREARLPLPVLETKADPATALRDRSQAIHKNQLSTLITNRAIVAFALKVDEADEREQAANKKSHLSVLPVEPQQSIAQLSLKQRKGRRSNDVRFWHLADLDADPEHVPPLGVKRTWPSVL